MAKKKKAAKKASKKIAKKAAAKTKTKKKKAAKKASKKIARKAAAKPKKKSGTKATRNAAKKKTASARSAKKTTRKKAAAKPVRKAKASKAARATKKAPTKAKTATTPKSSAKKAAPKKRAKPTATNKRSTAAVATPEPLPPPSPSPQEERIALDGVSPVVEEVTTEVAASVQDVSPEAVEPTEAPVQPSPFWRDLMQPHEVQQGDVLEHKTNKWPTSAEPTPTPLWVSQPATGGGAMQDTHVLDFVGNPREVGEVLLRQYQKVGDPSEYIAKYWEVQNAQLLKIQMTEDM